ncbi:2-oxoglutarate dehydrogenase E1 component [bacterium]|nr:2-oxoglutarate dehydrogenase E1 component [bacterium]
MQSNDTTPSDQTLMFGGNAGFLEGLYEDYLHDPASIDPEWRQYFDALKTPGSGPDTAHSAIQRSFAEMAQQGPRRQVVATECEPLPHGVSALINAYRNLGHLAANFNPLPLRPKAPVPELELSYYGLSEAVLDSPVTNGDLKGTLREVLAIQRETYCGPIGFEYRYLPRVEREWLQQRIEQAGGKGHYDAKTKRAILDKVVAAEGLEKYLHMRYVGQKRFSLEGGDSLIPLLDRGLHHAGKTGTKEVVIGMAHRGRLNVLINIFGKKASELFAEFEGKKVYAPAFSGDVKYHLGFSSDIKTEGGEVHLSLAFNPSHLEIIGPVVEGSVRAREDRLGDTQRTRVLPILIHGDAAVAGQGVVAETLNLSQLRGYATGGSLHVVINNQVGFSISDPRDARSSRYCTDIAKFIDAPVFHVNGDDPEAAAFAMELALDYRNAFQKDVFIDLVCWRRYGHNESDEPRATQPMMYQLIDKHPGVLSTYVKRLEAEGSLKAGEAKTLSDAYRDALDRGERVAEATESTISWKRAADWKPYVGQTWTAAGDTGTSLDNLKRLGDRLTTIPEGFKLHSRVDRIIQSRRDMLAGKVPLDWGMAENLAYATLLTAGYPIRISGQDSGRGTFFHRHAVLHETSGTTIPEGDLYVPLQHLSSGQARFEVIDSTLSEEAVLAFEYGYTSTEPDALVIWEAQYGDFANGAQAVIDQFISAGETKWQRLSGLVMMLPHGYEGQGPEHSSARLERYMQLCAEDNIQVCVPSTPAQMYHMLRRQMLRPYRKPLIIMSPKSMLRHKLSVSTLDELATGRFQEVIGDDRPSTGINRVVLCSGKLYWELVEAREQHGLNNVALIRLEQLYPFPEAQIKAELAKYPNAPVVWAQEEPLNQGAWYSFQDNLRSCLAQGQTLTCASRPCSASPAVGYASKHVEQQQAIINQALMPEPVAQLGAKASV